MYDSFVGFMWPTSTSFFSQSRQFSIVAGTMAADRFNINRQWEHLQAKYVGTGHADTTKFEWAVNQHRDTLASHLGHSDMMAYFAVAENESMGRVRSNMLEKMLQPCGPPPQKEEE